MCKACHWFNKLFGTNCHCGRGVCKCEGGKCQQCGKEGCQCENGECKCADHKSEAAPAAGNNSAPMSGSTPEQKM